MEMVEVMKVIVMVERAEVTEMIEMVNHVNHVGCLLDDVEHVCVISIRVLHFLVPHHHLLRRHLHVTMLLHYDSQYSYCQQCLFL